MRISQREAQRLRKQVKNLTSLLATRRHGWAQDYPGGLRVGSYTGWGPDATIPTIVRTARKCGHAVVVIAETNGALNFFALPEGAP